MSIKHAMLSDKDPHVRDAAVAATARIAMFLREGDIVPLRGAAEASDPGTQAKIERLVSACLFADTAKQERDRGRKDIGVGSIHEPGKRNGPRFLPFKAAS